MFSILTQTEIDKPEYKMNAYRVNFNFFFI